MTKESCAHLVKLPSRRVITSLQSREYPLPGATNPPCQDHTIGLPCEIPLRQTCGESSKSRNCLKCCCTSSCCFTRNKADTSTILPRELLSNAGRLSVVVMQRL